jgi:streptogramin lyase
MRWSLRTLTILFCVGTTVRADLFAIEGGSRSFLRRYSSTGQRLGLVTSSESLGNLLVGPDSHLYVLSNVLGYGDIRRIDPATGGAESLLLPPATDITKTALTIPNGIVFDDSSRLYVGSNALGGGPPWFGVTGVMRYDAGNRRLDPLITFSGDEYIAPLWFDPDGTLLISVNSVVRRYDPSTGADLGVVPSPFLGVTGPDGNLYARDGQGGIRRYESDGTLLGPFIPSGAGGLMDVTDFTFGGDGFLYVASQKASAVLRYRADTGAFVDRFIDYSSDPDGAVWEIEAITVPEPGLLIWAVGGVLFLTTTRPQKRE